MKEDEAIRNVPIRQDPEIKAAREICILFQKINIEDGVSRVSSPGPVQIAEIIERYSEMVRTHAAELAETYARWLVDECESMPPGSEAYNVAGMIRSNMTTEQAKEHIVRMHALSKEQRSKEH